MNKLFEKQIEDIRKGVKNGIEKGLDVVSNTPLGLRVIYSADHLNVYTTMSELLIKFTANDFKFCCRIPLWVNGQYDLTSDGDLLTSFNHIRSIKIDEWVFATITDCIEYQQWLGPQQAYEPVAESKGEPVIKFGIIIHHTKNRYTRVSGEEVWKYVDMPTPSTMKLVDPDSNEDIQGGRLEVICDGELDLPAICEAFRHQYLENK
ncbi:hypothetical protein pETSU_253 [Edwardsiella phage pEt-SU]|uniref:Uncharacterized protein n=1 Tax=Edwardsiella phage pEt-SU TaxID=2562142 RepID=A0A4D6DX14_9CAUD|nr:hypothetical protein HOV39_gp269 [Edwardsiella phage pEt-SU]QBZ70834.1 hypothetical protein pETSU_253 [Edwardsiella phage pEt-SU]